MQLYVGTSGYSYKEWKGSFYPEKIPAKEMLSYYATRLPAVEINNTFYRLPQKSVLENWKEQVPAGFKFSVKTSQRITHFKRLREVEEETRFFFDTIQALEDRLGVVLVQLPPNMKKDLERLKTFVELLPPGAPVSFEFRHPSWFEDDVIEMLSRHNLPLCVSDTDEMPVHHIDRTADWGYLRLRRVIYSETHVSDWLERVRAQNWKAAYVFFKHEDEGTGPRLAAQFIAAAQAAGVIPAEQ
jgi:uncharacterized protein YecE (DUF72 family)